MPAGLDVMSGESMRNRPKAAEGDCCDLMDTLLSLRLSDDGPDPMFYQ